jgi:hypothetical protein
LEAEAEVEVAAEEAADKATDAHAAGKLKADFQLLTKALAANLAEGTEGAAAEELIGQAIKTQGGGAMQPASPE